MDSYRKVPADLLAAIAGYSFKTYIPPPPPVGFVLNLFNGLTEPDTKDGIWIKTEDELLDSIIQMWLVQNDMTWTTGNAMPSGAYDLAGASVGDKVYMCGGVGATTVTRIYDTATGTWTTGNAMPNGDSILSGATVGTKVYVCGGNFAKTATRIYDTTTGTWTTGNAMPNGDYKLAGASVGDKVYMCGGDANPGRTSNRIYDTTTGTWTLGASIPNMGYGGAAVAAVGTKVYVCGGHTVESVTRIYDTTTGTWTAGNAMPNGASYSMVGASMGTKVYVCGGNSAKTATRIYDTTTGTWTTGPNSLNDIVGAGGATNGVNIHVCGGYLATTSTRILGTDDTIDQPDGTVMMAVGTLTHINTEKVVKLAEGITLNIADVWIVQSGYMLNYETYYGNGVSWVKMKDAD